MQGGGGAVIGSELAVTGSASAGPAKAAATGTAVGSDTSKAARTSDKRMNTRSNARYTALGTVAMPSRTYSVQAMRGDGAPKAAINLAGGKDPQERDERADAQPGEVKRRPAEQADPRAWGWTRTAAMHDHSRTE